MFRRRFANLTLSLLAIVVVGCSEGAKPTPLRRAGAPASLAAPIVDSSKDGAKVPPTTVEGKSNGKTLYERLGREEGLTSLVHQLAVDLSESPKTAKLAARLNKRSLVEFLMEATSRPRAGLMESTALTQGDWSQILPALGLTLIAQGTPEADRDELLANIAKCR